MQRSKEFKVSAPGLPTDTIIGYFLGTFGALFVILSIIKSIITQGKVQRVYGVLMVSALLMAFTGIVFSAIGYRADNGGITNKKMAIILNVVVLISAVIFLLLGL
ncbi:MAG: hypothetical protein PUG00_03350 [Clostridiales bacterium]|nr:hypothetical protein [Clostridiales bacterium]